MSDYFVLIVDSDDYCVKKIEHILMTRSFTLYIAKTVEEAKASIEKIKFDLMVVNAHLEHSKKGIEFVKKYNRQNPIPVIYLTIYTDEKTLIEVLSTNANVFLLKPLDKIEFLTTVSLLLKKPVQEFLTIEPLNSDYMYDYKTKTCISKKNSVKLTKKESQFIELLLGQKNTVVSFCDIEDILWPDGHPNTGTRRALIYRLNAKFEKPVIVSIVGVGCKLAQ